MELREIFRVVAKWLDNNGYKISWQSLENWLTGYQKANFYFGPSSTVGQTIVNIVVKLPIEKTGEAPVWCLHTLIWLSSSVQSICDAEKMYGRHR